MNNVRLGDYVNIKTGKLDANASSEDGQYPFFTCSRDNLWISTFAYDCECVLVAGNGDLNVKYYSGKFNAYQRTYIIESKNKEVLLTKYVYFFLDKYVEVLREQSIGGVIKYIKIANLTDIEIPLPDVQTQLLIVQACEKAGILIAKRQEQIITLDKLAKDAFIDIFGDLERNSKGWDIKNILNISSFDTKMTTDFEKYADFYHIGIENIEKETGKLVNMIKVKDSNLISGKYIFGERHIIYSKIRPNLNKVALPTFSGVCSADSYPILVKSDICNRNYLAFVLRSEFFLSYIMSFSGRTNIPKVNKKQISGFHLPVPPIDLQNKFAVIVTTIEHKKTTLQRSLFELEITYNSILQKSFNGELF